MSRPKLDGEDEYFVMMPAWESVKECPKCGEEREQGRRQKQPPENPLWGWTERITWIESGGFKYEYVSDTTGDPNEVGHMEVICLRCGHGWDELPKDAQDNE